MIKKIKNNQHHFLNGVKDSLPVVLGYITIGLALGIMAGCIGFTPFQMGSMSVIVYAGSAQFIGVDLISQGTAVISIIITTFFVNFRHFLMSSAYAPFFHNEKPLYLAILSFGITDETFAVGINTCKNNRDRFNKYYMLGLHIASQSSWVIATIIGIFFGGMIPNYEQYGLDFALPAMFIGLIVLLVKDKASVIVCIIAAILSILLLEIGMNNWNVIIAAIVASGAMVIVRRLSNNKKEQSNDI